MRKRASYITMLRASRLRRSPDKKQAPDCHGDDMKGFEVDPDSGLPGAFVFMINAPNIFPRTTPSYTRKNETLILSSRGLRCRLTHRVSLFRGVKLTRHTAINKKRFPMRCKGSV